MPSTDLFASASVFPQVCFTEAQYTLAAEFVLRLVTPADEALSVELTKGLVAWFKTNNPTFRGPDGSITWSYQKYSVLMNPFSQYVDKLTNQVPAENFSIRLAKDGVVEHFNPQKSEFTNLSEEGFQDFPSCGR